MLPNRYKNVCNRSIGFFYFFWVKCYNVWNLYAHDHNAHECLMVEFWKHSSWVLIDSLSSLNLVIFKINNCNHTICGKLNVCNALIKQFMRFLGTLCLWYIQLTFTYLQLSDLQTASSYFLITCINVLSFVWRLYQSVIIQSQNITGLF